MASCCNRPCFFAALLSSLALGFLTYSIVQSLPAEARVTPATIIDEDERVDETDAIATFGAGCFWCVEAVFQELKGVKSVTSGFMGGTVANPTYAQISTGQTGHAEVCRIVYEPEVISFEKLLEVFWRTHDPTTLNRQGHDTGPQYRSVIFYHDDNQKKLAESLMQKLDQSGAFDDPVVTEITAASEFYKADDYHQNYFSTNPTSTYCQAVIVPKMKKFREVFAEHLKQKTGK